MPGPLLLVAAPLLLAAIFSLTTRRWPLATGLAAAVATLLLRFLLAARPLDGSDIWIILGRALTLTADVQQMLLLLYGLAALLFFLAAFWPPGPDFVPAGLATLAPLAVALMLRPSVFSMVPLLIAAALGAMLVQSGRTGSTRAALRYLLMTALAVPLFLVAGWMLESQPGALLGVVWRLLLVGFLILLASFPFHIWVRPLLDEASPLAVAFAVGPVQIVLLLLGFALLSGHPAVEQDTSFLALLRLGGIVTLLIGGGLALAAQGWRRLLGSLLLADMGLVLLAFSFGFSGLPAALHLLLLRVLALALAGVGLAELDWPAGEAQFAAGRGLARERPVAAALLVLGTLSLAGLPLTPGFLGHWQVTALLAFVSPWYVLAAVLAVSAGVIGVLRGLGWLLAPCDSPAGPVAPAAETTLLERVRRPVLVLLLAAGLLLTFLPQPLLNAAARLAALG